jgi:hypothetical protein
MFFKGIVIKDHHAAFETNIRLTVRRSRGENTRGSIFQGVVDQVFHLID